MFNGMSNGMSGLQSLYLGNNQLTSVTTSDFNGIISTLTFLDLGYNQFASLPSNMFNGLDGLKTLNLNDNQISSIATGAFN